MGYGKPVDITVGRCSSSGNFKRHKLKAELFAGTCRSYWCKRIAQFMACSCPILQERKIGTRDQNIRVGQSSTKQY